MLALPIEAQPGTSWLHANAGANSHVAMSVDAAPPLHPHFNCISIRYSILFKTAARIVSLESISFGTLRFRKQVAGAPSRKRLRLYRSTKTSDTESFRAGIAAVARQGISQLALLANKEKSLAILGRSSSMFKG